MNQKEAPKILIVDDDKSMLKGFRQTLELEGYVVDTAESGREAIEKSKAVVYNLALIDIRLPDMEGTELLTAMRDTIPKMRKIIVTGYPSLQNAIAAVNKGADFYIIKPVNMNDLLSMIKAQLKKQVEELEYELEYDKKVAWSCYYCGKSNFPERTTCWNCGR
jgi:DNA-binding NtrC family response regulator